MKIKRADHFTINMKNVEKSLWFYGKLLGLEQLPSIDMGDHYLYYFFIPGGQKLELTEYRFPTEEKSVTAENKGSARHLAFEVEDVYEMEKILTKNGFPFHVPVSFNNDLGFSGGLTKDPNGFELEFLEYPVPELQKSE